MREQGRVATRARPKRLEVVRHLALEELGRLGSGQAELAASGAVNEPDGLAEAFVVGCDDHLIDSRQGPSPASRD